MDDGIREVREPGGLFVSFLILEIDHLQLNRFNKYLKNLLRNANRAPTVMANSVAIDMAASYVHLCMSLRKYDVSTAFHHTCLLRQQV